jgi:hypothetical protein
MTLFDGHSVVVVGAGGSIDLGLPLGGQLWDVVSSDAYNMKAKTAGERNMANVRLLARDDPKLFAYASAILDAQAAGHALSPTSIAEAVLADRVYPNVDEFVRNHPSIASPIAALVAANLFNKLYQPKDGEWLRPAEMLYPKVPTKDGRSHVTNWMVLFVGLCRNWLWDGPPLGPLRVVNFNYDRVFETILRELWENAERSYPAFDDCFQFLYPYGSFSHLPSRYADAGSFLAAEYKNFGFVGEASPVALAISAAVRDAKRLFFVGFSFAAGNIKILGLTAADGRKISVGDRIRVQNFDRDDVRLARIMENFFGLDSSSCESAGADRLVHNGFFEH